MVSQQTDRQTVSQSVRHESQTGLANIANRAPQWRKSPSSPGRWCKSRTGSRTDSKSLLLGVVPRGTVSRLLDRILFSSHAVPHSHAAPASCRAFPFIHPRLASRIAPFGHLGTTRPGKSGNPASQRLEQVLRETQFTFLPCLHSQSCEIYSGVDVGFASF